MKKLLITILFAMIAMPALAQYHRHHHGYWQQSRGNGWVWVAPAIIGGVISYEISRNQPPIVVQQPVIIQQPPLQNCSPWTEVQNPDGTITRTRTCSQ